MRKTALFLATLLTAAYALAQVFYSENVTAGVAGASVPTLSNFAGARSVTVTPTAANTVYVRYSRDYLLDGDFEDAVQADTPDPVAGQGFLDSWDANGTLTSWGFTENTVLIEKETTNAIYNGSSLRFDAGSVSQLIANEDFELATGDDFDDWTENVNAGTGTIESDEASPYDGTIDAKLTGGTAHVDLSSATVTVTASTDYVLSVWGYVGAADDMIDVRVQEATGGTDYLQADGTWDAAEVDHCEPTFDNSTTTYQQCVVEFTTDTGITGLTISVHADVSGDIGFIDGFSLHVKDSTVQIQATSRIRIYDTNTGAYTLAFTQDSVATGSARVEYAIIDPNDNATRYYYTGSAWTTTETWISSAYAGTATQTLDYFEARVATGHYVQIRIRPETLGEDEDIYLDKVFVVAAARAGTSVLINTTPTTFDTWYPGRFSVYDDGSSTVVNFAASQ